MARALVAAAMDLDADVKMPPASPAGGEEGGSTRRRFAPDRGAPRFASPSYKSAPALAEGDPRRARVVLVPGASLTVVRDDRRVVREGVGLTIAQGRGEHRRPDAMFVVN